MMQKKKEHIVKNVKPGSIAEEMEIEAGDYLLTVNNEEINDILDYKYQMFDEYVTLLIEKPNGEQWDLEIEKDENEDIVYTNKPSGKWNYRVGITNQTDQLSIVVRKMIAENRVFYSDNETGEVLRNYIMWSAQYSSSRGD